MEVILVMFKQLHFMVSFHTPFQRITETLLLERDSNQLSFQYTSAKNCRTFICKSCLENATYFSWASGILSKCCFRSFTGKGN